jgi:hypothetical protein
MVSRGCGPWHRDAAELGEFRDVSLVVESTRNQHVECGVAVLAGGGDKIGAARWRIPD